MANNMFRTPPRRYIPREGLYIDPVFRLLAKTVFNPLVSGSLVLVCQQFQASEDSGFRYYVLRNAKLATVLGAIFWANQFLNWGTNNNFIRSKSWDPKKELVLITGGSSGIGASVAMRLAREGTQVVILDILPLGFPARNNISYYKCDLSDMARIKDVMATVREEHGAPTVLGLSRGFNIADGSYHDNDLTLRINLLAAFLMTKECLPSMVTKNHGHIINISSMSAFIPPAGLADYSASKAGLVAFHEALGLEICYRHIAPAVRKSLFVLSFTKTPLFEGKTKQNVLLLPLLHVDTVGDEIVDTVYRGNSRTIFMPGILRYLAWIRGSPDWFQHIIRKSTEDLEVNFQGRQVIDPKTGKLKV